MKEQLQLFNTLSRKKEVFEPYTPPHVGMYVCGPTVYGDAHLGHARPAITFDLLFRYLKYLGYKVRYVRNITDVGHLENDADEGEDKIGKKARLEKLEPMEVVHYYSNRYHQNMAQLNTLPPSIEPTASGHIIEQQQMVAEILKNGYAYEVDGSVYFDVEKYNKEHRYGKLSGRNIEELYTNTRNLEGQQEKKQPYDFALWKKAQPGHIMKWGSEWGTGYPGWHLECSVMSTKYLGARFDIHGGGMDLLFPHHDCEIAQSVAANGKEAVRYWMHNNMITINGQKMGKSLGNFITLNQLFAGEHELLAQPYHPMIVRFFILQSHYRNPLDFSNEALQASEKGLRRLFAAWETLERIEPAPTNEMDVEALRKKAFDALNDDLNTPVLLAHLFDAVRQINAAADGQLKLDAHALQALKGLYKDIVFDVLGLQGLEEEKQEDTGSFARLVDLLLEERLAAKKRKDFATADRIRDNLKELNIVVKDKKDSFEWNVSR